ncbi:unnamed protein product [Albugo candida]|uniref:Uncharacterized protein n=1 Tax=Albugo candida TaxID=65357 RepID=A0A024GPX1_9STRA|nr:unnamed protein product [Albugo candida]|eukprot:CCI48394.1 unnamed protein product [Albugo candida]
MSEQDDGGIECSFPYPSDGFILRIPIFEFAALRYIFLKHRSILIIMSGLEPRGPNTIFVHQFLQWNCAIISLSILRGKAEVIRYDKIARSNILRTFGFTGGSFRYRQMELQRWEDKNFWKPNTPRFPLPKSFPLSVCICGSVYKSPTPCISTARIS